MEIRRGDGQRGDRTTQPLQLAFLGNDVLWRGQPILYFVITITKGGRGKKTMSGSRLQFVVQPNISIVIQ